MCCICNKLFTHKNDIPSVTVQATITFMNPLTFSSFIQSCNTCEILQNTNCSSKFSCAYFPTLFNRHIFPRLVLVSCFTARGAATYFPVLGAGHIFSRSQHWPLFPRRAQQWSHILPSLVPVSYFPPLAPVICFPRLSWLHFFSSSSVWQITLFEAVYSCR